MCVCMYLYQHMFDLIELINIGMLLHFTKKEQKLGCYISIVSLL